MFETLLLTVAAGVGAGVTVGESLIVIDKLTTNPRPTEVARTDSSVGADEVEEALPVGVTEQLIELGLEPGEVSNAVLDTDVAVALAFGDEPGSPDSAGALNTWPNPSTVGLPVLASAPVCGCARGVADGGGGYNPACANYCPRAS